MYKAIIFDLDGTLLNTSGDINAVLNASLEAFGCPQISLQKTIEYVGDGARKLIERAAPPDFDRIEELYSYYRVHFAACDNSRTTLYEGEDFFLREVKSLGIKLAILTNKPDDAAKGVCGKLLSGYGFDYILGQTDKFPLKPAPAAVQYLIGQLGVASPECLFVGDGETDIATAANAGIDCASVLWGFRSAEQLKSAGGKLFVRDYPELLSVVFKK